MTDPILLPHWIASLVQYPRLAQFPQRSLSFRYLCGLCGLCGDKRSPKPAIAAPQTYGTPYIPDIDDPSITLTFR